MLVAVDGSPEGYNALIWVLEHIKEEGRACALYVISPAKYAAIDGAAGYEGISTLHEIREKLVQDEKEQVTNRIKELAHDRNVDIEIIVRTGDPRSEILQTAEEVGADLINRKRTGCQNSAWKCQYIYYDPCKSYHRCGQVSFLTSE